MHRVRVGISAQYICKLIEWQWTFQACRYSRSAREEIATAISLLSQRVLGQRERGTPMLRMLQVAVIKLEIVTQPHGALQLGNLEHP